ncbi:MAG: hypothetical protein A2039_07305 [Candidatus Melainabacteria bacterium GWA2_34_9]|nr:MAG: hypothetical protein A2039_07305 [Candidatus Melainabacteria bacterium GWA2_34_9]
MKKNYFILINLCLSVFLGAFLIFMIQPLAGKIILPKYGGGAQIWCVCLFFFQAILLLGYTIAYLLNYLKPRTLAIIYILSAIISALTIKIPISADWILPDYHPSLSILLILSFYLALPVSFLSTISITTQNWHRISFKDSPYYLYALSNAGSFLALLIYPFLIEPNLTISQSIKLWDYLYKALSLIICVMAFLILKTSYKEPSCIFIQTQEENETTRPVLSKCGLWLLFSAIGNITLLSFTNFILKDIAPVPLLWILPLAIYLGAFTICFSSEQFYKRAFFFVITPLLTLFMLFYPYTGEKLLLFTINSLLLFSISMICCGEIYKSRPDPKNLSVFYLLIGFGGVLGGVFVNFIAPYIFNNYFEINFVILFITFFIGLCAYHCSDTTIKHKIPLKIYSFLLILFCSIQFFVFFIQKNTNFTEICVERNFYGVSKVLLKENKLFLYNGTVVHGFQAINPKNQKFYNIPTAYYSTNSAFGIINKLFRSHRNNKPLKIGVIGLGIGTVATYGEKGDKFDFYELDPQISNIAFTKFGFLKNTKADVNVIPGDGRLSLKKQPAQNYDIILVDVFSGDSIPVHVLTKEAVEIYTKHLKKDGLILIHTSNDYLNLSLIIKNLALDLKLNDINIITKNDNKFSYNSTYCILSKESWIIDKITRLNFKKEYPYTNYFIESKTDKINKNFVWTDNYSNLFSILNK